MGHVSDRANNFAKRFVKQEEPDDRSQDEKMAAFIKEYEPRDRLRSARRRVRKVRNRNG